MRYEVRPLVAWTDPETRERWVTIASHPDYQVSDRGRVRRATGGKGVRAGRVLVPQPINSGYLVVNLYLSGVQSKRTVHGLVAEAFLGSRPPGAEVNHRDGVKTHNAACNLEFCTSSQNKHHASAANLGYVGVLNSQARLSDEQVRQIRIAAASGESQRSVAARFGVTQGHVSDIITGKKRRWEASGAV